MDIEIGKEYRVKYPFVLEQNQVWIGDDAPYPDELYRPGCKSVDVYPDDSKYIADAEGEMILTIKDIHKPPGYRKRVFYTRKFIDPDGNEFGKGNLHVITDATFKRRASGYYYEYDIE